MARIAQAVGENDDPVPVRKGRPVVMDAEERRDVILGALDDHFHEVGLAGMTMAAIARRAGMSKQTLYGLFQDRDTLFDAYIERRFARCAPMPDLPEDASFAVRLRKLFMIDEPGDRWDLPIALFRLAIAEAAQHPRLSRRCLEEGPRNKQAIVRAEIERACARGELRVGDPAAAATLLLDMLNLPVIEALIMTDEHPCQTARKARFELGLRVFLNGIS
ncbi:MULTISPECIES: TetR/AcrR family transcriptional regulator [unclassified Sagittula]|uniref:TetR/AcrR family transcriptional regulator n=1 Tax=unclassified Sagittula TaxID=2624628 RepID=UPI0024C432D5|nr:TetR/AcrR family transcriptional regulator [Sagittula sp. MA-2]WHZ34421.1 TetR/AcrR family transcriptional regulator [Sagittula sp. MA-2]